MTLHETVESVKKISIGSGIGLAVLIVLMIFFRIAVIIYNVLFPPPILPPTLAYGKLASIKFPKSVTNKNFVYHINTTTGELPTDFPDRLTIFKTVYHAPNFLNLDKIKNKVSGIGFVSKAGTVVKEKSLGNAIYEWDQPPQITGVTKKIKFNINTFDFVMTSDYLSNLTVLAGEQISSRQAAVDTAKGFLNSISLFPTDIDVYLTSEPPEDKKWLTKPQLFDIDKNVGRLIPVQGLDQTKIIRVDFYQKNMDYSLNTGRSDDKHILQRVDVSIPIVYSNPPYSTMTLWVGSGQNMAEVIAADYTHQDIEIPEDYEATYYIKPVQDAYDELQKGNAYIASYNGNKNDISIDNVFYAYYMGKTPQKYLMPVYVFQGSNNFFAYVSALSEDMLE